MKKILRNIVSLLICLLLFSQSLIVSSAQTMIDDLFYSVQYETQQRTLWCWNACSRMAAKHAYSNVTLTQTDVAHEIFGLLYDDDYGNSATMQQTASAMVIYTDDTKDAGYTSNACSYSTLSNKMTNSGHPICMGIYYTNIGENHMLLGRGYQTFDTSSYNSIFYVDPQLGYNQCDKYTDIFDGTYAVQKGMAYFMN